MSEQQEPNKPYTERLKVKLHPRDLQVLGKRLAEETQAANQLEIRKAEVASSLASQLKGHKANIAEMSAKINQGYEERDVECTWMMDTGAKGEPATGLKSLFRNDTGEWVKTDPMTQADMQLGIDLQPSPEDRKEAGPEGAKGESAEA